MDFEKSLLAFFVLMCIAMGYLLHVADDRVQSLEAELSSLQLESLSISSDNDSWYEGYSEGYDVGYEEGYNQGELDQIVYFTDYVGSDEFYNDYGLEKP